MIDAGNMRIYEHADFETGEIVIVVQLFMEDFIISFQMLKQDDMTQPLIQMAKNIVNSFPEEVEENA